MKLDAYVRKGFTPNSPSPPHGLARDLVPRAGQGQPASEQQAKLRERHRAAEQDSRREAISSLGHKDMAAIQDGLKCYSPKTATITQSVLKNALEARDENLIRTNPAKMVRPVSGRRRPMKVLSPRRRRADKERTRPDGVSTGCSPSPPDTEAGRANGSGLTMDELTTLNGRRALVIDHQLQRIPTQGRRTGLWARRDRSGQRLLAVSAQDGQRRENRGLGRCDVRGAGQCRHTRAKRRRLPMLFVTGRGTPIDRRIEYFHWDRRCCESA